MREIRGAYLFSFQDYPNFFGVYYTKECIESRTFILNNDSELKISCQVSFMKLPILRFGEYASFFFNRST